MDAQAAPRCPHCFAATTATLCPACGWQPGADNPPPALALGILLDGRYRLGRVLGHGGFGITYLAWDENLQLRLAIKEYLPRDSASRTPDGVSLAVYSGPAAEQFAYGLERFLEEARALARFDQHPGIVTVKSFFRAHGTGYSVMDYVEGLTFKQYLAAQPGGRLPFESALTLLLPIMDALRAVHQEGLLHRDIAPDNIYVSRSGRIKLLDFGAARFAAGEHSKSLSVILKPGYAPEEQYRTKGKQGPWTDVYSLAATLYHTITGILPPEALDRVELDELVPPSRLGIAIAPAQEAVLLKALAVRAGGRYPSVAALQEAWREAEFSKPAMPEPLNDSQFNAPADQPSSPVKPRSRMLTAVLLIALFAMLGFGMMVLIPPPLEPTLPPLAVQPPPVSNPEPQSPPMSESDFQADQLAERQRQQQEEQNRLAEQQAARGREIAALEQRFDAHLASHALTTAPDDQYALADLEQVLTKVAADERWLWNGLERDRAGIEADGRRRIADHYLSLADQAIEHENVDSAKNWLEMAKKIDDNNISLASRHEKIKLLIQQSILPLKKDQLLQEAHAALIKQGWKSRKTFEKEYDGTLRRFSEPYTRSWYELGYHGVETCAPTGVGPCIFNYINEKGNCLRIFTVGEVDPEVVGWRYECPEKDILNPTPRLNVQALAPDNQQTTETTSSKPVTTTAQIEATLNKTANSASSEVVIEFTGSTWISVMGGDENVVLSGEMRQGDRHVLKGRPPYKFVIGNASATRMTVDGQVFNIMGRSRGNVARFSFDPADLR